MSTAYRQLLDAAVAELESQRSRGVRFVAASADALTAIRPGIMPSLPSAQAGSVAPKPVVRVSIEKPAPSPAAAANFEGDRLSGDAKHAAFAELRQRALSCVKCPKLVATRRQVVFGVGSPDATIMFVGEAPGMDEDRQGEPFVGKAGQLLTRIIETMGLRREEVYIANILKCRPDTPGQLAGNRKPMPEEMHTCAPWLHEQIELIRPKVLVGLGATAIEGLFGTPAAITRTRGQWRVYRGIPLMPTYHPAYLLRNQLLQEKRKVWEDMLAVMERLEMPISEKQRRFFLKG